MEKQQATSAVYQVYMSVKKRYPIFDEYSTKALFEAANNGTGVLNSHRLVQTPILANIRNFTLIF
jgi:hypothetical protein